MENLCLAAGARAAGVERLSSAFQRERAAQLCKRLVGVESPVVG